MICKLANLAVAAGLIDPHTKRRPFLDSDTGLPILEGVEVPENNHWCRRIIDGDIVRVDGPVGNEPIAPLTTRGTRR